MRAWRSLSLWKKKERRCSLHDEVQLLMNAEVGLCWFFGKIADKIFGTRVPVGSPSLGWRSGSIFLTEVISHSGKVLVRACSAWIDWWRNDVCLRPRRIDEYLAVECVGGGNTFVDLAEGLAETQWWEFAGKQSKCGQLSVFRRENWKMKWMQLSHTSKRFEIFLLN